MKQLKEGEVWDWVTDTPPEETYSLTMFGAGGGGEQEIDITRDEYINLKRHLAAWRGYTTGEAADRVDELVKQIAAGDTDCTVSATVQQVATYLVEARALYRLCPEAVVSPEGDFDKALKELAGE